MSTRHLFVLVGIPASMRDLLGEGQLRKLAHAHPRVQVDIVDEPAQFAARISHADVAIVQARFRFPPEMLRPEARLRWIQVVTAGVNQVLTPELVAADHVTITSSKGPMAPLMAEHAVMLMLALARNLPGCLHSQAQHVWSRQDYAIPFMMQLFRKTIAILGVGGVGGYLAQICKSGFGMQVLGMARTSRSHPAIDRYFQRSELHTALGEADVVALCLPLTPATARIIDAEALAAMKPTAYLINVARGPLVDEEALIHALQQGKIAGAGLDTTTVEPLPEASPLWTLPQVIITPHVAAGTDGIGENLVDFWCENIRRFAEHEPLLGVVDRHTGY